MRAVCAHCGNLVTGEQVVKKSSGKQYVYYRCTMYNKRPHPRIRVTEQQLDEQILAVFKTIKQPEQVRHWFSRALVEWSKSERGESQEHTQQLQRELTLVRQQQTRLLNLRLLEEIDADTFASKGTELRDRIAQLTLQVEASDRGRGEQADLAIKCFELSQTLTEKWLTADFSTKRQILEIVFLNFKLDNTTLCYETRKPFDVLTEGLSVLSSRGDRI